MNISAFKLKVVLLFIFMMLSLPNVKGENMSILDDKPLYKISINGSGEKYIVWINGVVVYQEMDASSQITTTLPVNHWMRSGANNIELSIFPSGQDKKPNKNAEIDIRLLVSSNNNPETEHAITSIVFKGGMVEENKPFGASGPSGRFDSRNNFAADSSGDVVVDDVIRESSKNSGGVISGERKVHASSSLPLWSFFNSDDLPNIDAMSDAEYYKFLDTLLLYYLKVQKAIETSQTDTVVSMFEERNRELDSAFYLPPGTTEAKIRKSLKDAAENANLELLILKQEHVSFTIEDNKKLASLTRSGQDPAIILNFKNGAGSQHYPLMFRYQRGQWILTR